MFEVQRSEFDVRQQLSVPQSVVCGLVVPLSVVTGPVVLWSCCPLVRSPVVLWSVVPYSVVPWSAPLPLPRSKFKVQSSAFDVRLLRLISHLQA
jgi:hypothetical protein